MKCLKVVVCVAALLSSVIFPLIASSALKAKDKITVAMPRPATGWKARIGDSAFGHVSLPIAPDTMTPLTGRLILRDRVDFLPIASGTSFLFALAPAANIMLSAPLSEVKIGSKVDLNHSCEIIERG